MILAGVRTNRSRTSLAYLGGIAKHHGTSLNALAACQTISISVSRSLRKRSIPLSSSSNNIGQGLFKKKVLGFLKKRSALSTRNIYGISCARSYRTLRDGSFWGGDVPGTSCQATIGLSLRDVTPYVGAKYPKLPLTSRHSGQTPGLSPT